MNNTERNELDPGIESVVKLLNEMGFTTISSCEGHPFGGHIAFISDDIPKWIDTVMNNLIAEEHDLCVGCTKTKIEYSVYTDCSNTIKRIWIISNSPRPDYGDEAKRDVDQIWAIIERSLLQFKEQQEV